MNPDGIYRRAHRGGGGDATPSFSSGGGGDSGGGGASGTFDAPDAASDLATEPLVAIGEAAGSAFDADEFVIPIVVVALAVGLAFASLYVVYIAPVPRQ